MKTFLKIFIMVISAQLASGQTITDLFYKIPEQYFTDFKEFVPEKINSDLRKKLIAKKSTENFEIEKIDTKNGYLSFFTKTDGEGMSAQVTYWRFGKSILLSLVIDRNANCTDYSKRVVFFEYTNGKLVDVTKSFSPKLNLKSFENNTPENLKNFSELFKTIWKLPKEGKKINISAFHYDCGGTIWYPTNGVYFEMEPTSTKTFKIVKKYGENPNN
jgi:hypothetical protein